MNISGESISRDDQRVFLESNDNNFLCCWKVLSVLSIPLMQVKCKGPWTWLSQIMVS